MFPTIYGILSQLGLSFLLRDDFTTPEAAPIASPRTAEPGPGTLTIVDTANNLSISGGDLVLAGGVSVYGDPGFTSDAVNRTSGVAYLSTITQAAGFLANGFSIDATPGTPIAGGFIFSAQTLRVYQWFGFLTVDAYTYSTNYSAMSILRDTGSFQVIKGGLFAEWTLIWVDNFFSTTPVYGTMANYNSTGTIGTARVSRLPAPFDTDNGIATDVHAGNVTQGTTFTHEADCLIEWAQTTVPSAGTQELWFRSPSVGVDGWRVTVDNTGALSLDEVVSSIPTTRGTAAGVIINGDRIVIVADDETIRIYDINVLRITYTSAVTNKTATAGELETLATGGAIADLISWPRVLSGAAKAALDEMAA